MEAHHYLCLKRAMFNENTHAWYTEVARSNPPHQVKKVKGKLMGKASACNHREALLVARDRGLHGGGDPPSCYKSLDLFPKT